MSNAEMFTMLREMRDAFEDFRKRGRSQGKEKAMPTENVLLVAAQQVQDDMATEQAAYLALRSHEYKQGFYSGKEFGLMAAGAQDFSARLAAKLA